MPETVQTKKQYLDAHGLSTFWGKVKKYVNDADATKLEEVLAGAGIKVTDKNTVAVKINNTAPGNVTLTADSDGLSANVTIPEATVTGVAENDKFLSLTDKLVGAAVSLSYDKTAKKIYLYGKDASDASKAVSTIDTTDFVKDGILDKVELTGNNLVFTWNADAGKTATTIDLQKFLDNVNFDGANLMLKALPTVDNYTAPKNGDSLDTAIANLAFGVAKAMQDAANAVVAGVTSFGGQKGALTVDTEGAGNGNVKFTMGADKKLKASVTGLGSAAYTESSAYATAAQGAKADTALQSLSKSGDGDYVTTTVGGEGTAKTVGVAVKIQDINTASEASKGVLEASNAKTYINTQIATAVAAEATEPIPDTAINALFTV